MLELPRNRVLQEWVFTWDDVQRTLPGGSGLCLDLGCGDGEATMNGLLERSK